MNVCENVRVAAVLLLLSFRPEGEIFPSDVGRRTTYRQWKDLLTLEMIGDEKREAHRVEFPADLG